MHADEAPDEVPEAKTPAPGEATGSDRLVQYSHLGAAFLPAVGTVRNLPPGIYRIVQINQQMCFERHHVVTDDLLRLPDSKSDMVISEIETFWPKKAIFKQFGFTHKRGVLLHGPPGSGKTSTIAFICKQMIEAKGIVILGNIHPQTLSRMLNEFRQIEPSRPVVVVMEDIDTIIKDHGESEVLALLDGESSIDSVVYLATTNYPENLDGRITNRPSRFDRVVEIGMPNEAARLLYLKSRKLPLKESELSKWAADTKELSISHIKEIIVGVFCFDRTFGDELKRIKSMKYTPKSGGAGNVGFGKE